MPQSNSCKSDAPPDASGGAFYLMKPARFLVFLLSAEKCVGIARTPGRAERGKKLCDRASQTYRSESGFEGIPTPGYEGYDCAEVAACDCSGRGVCAHGRCFCDPGFEGDDCSLVVECPEDCNSHGACVHGQCYCDPGYGGEACAVAQREIAPHHISARREKVGNAVLRYESSPSPFCNVSGIGAGEITLSSPVKNISSTWVEQSSGVNAPTPLFEIQ